MKYLKVYNKFQSSRRLFEDKVDNQKKANLVEKDVEDFFATLQKIAENPEGLKQQRAGSMTYQKEAETIQISLLLLGYELPKFGVDGLFGPETAAAIEKYKADNKNISEKNWSNSLLANRLIEELQLVELETTNFTNLKHDDDQTKNDKVSKVLLDDIQKAAKSAGVVAKINCAQHGHPSMNDPSDKSRHKRNIAVDISSIDGFGSGTSEFKQKGDKLKDELVKLGYTWNKESGETKSVLWQTNLGGDHFNHLHISNALGAESHQGVSPTGTESETILEPSYVLLMIDQLKKRGIKSTDLQRYINVGTLEGSKSFTRLDLTKENDYKTYAQICQKFIDANQPNLLEITGEMMAQSAKRAFDKYRSYVPPELALAQLVQEGGIKNGKKRSRPIRTKNPFNVGNTDSGENEFQNTVQGGIDRYYNLVASKYLGREKTADDLLQNYVNKNGSRYASDQNYEVALSNIVPKANAIANQILSSTEVEAQKQA